MIERFLISLIPAAVLLAVIAYSVWRARRESTALVDCAIANSNAQTAAILESWRATAGAANAVADPDGEPAARAQTAEPGIVPIREAFSTLMRDDDLALLRQTLRDGQSVEDAGRALGLTPDQSSARFGEALRRLCAFAEIAEVQGFATSPPSA